MYDKGLILKSKKKGVYAFMYMFKYILKRIGLMLMTFSIIFIMCFVLIRLLPVSFQAGFGEDPTKILAEYERRGYNKPLMEQLAIYLRRIIVNGDFGIITQVPQYRNRDIVTVFAEKIPATVLLNVYSSLFAVPLGIALGIFAALKKNKWQDHFIPPTSTPNLSMV